MLEAACRRNDCELVESVLTRSQPLKDRCTVQLEHAARHGHHELARLLILHGASPSGTRPRGRTPLHHAADRGDSHIVRLLLDAGVDAEGHLKMCPLLLAARAGDLECCRMLVQAGAGITNKGTPDKNVLRFAAMGGSVECRNREKSIF